MPVYEFTCLKCNKPFEIVRQIAKFDRNEDTVTLLSQQEGRTAVDERLCRHLQEELEPVIEGWFEELKARVPTNWFDSRRRPGRDDWTLTALSETRLSLLRRLRLVRFSTQPLPHGPSSDTTSRPVPVSRRGCAG